MLCHPKKPLSLWFEKVFTFFNHISGEEQPIWDITKTKCAHFPSFIDWKKGKIREKLGLCHLFLHRLSVWQQQERSLTTQTPNSAQMQKL